MALSDEQLKLLLEIFDLPEPKLFNRKKVIRLLLGHCEECDRVPAQLTVIYTQASRLKTVVVQQKQEKPCLPCQQNRK